MAYTLTELYRLYRRAGSTGTITTDDYRSVGGVVGALQRRADRLAAEFARVGLGEQVVPTLLRLATVEADGEPTRRRVLCRSLSPDEDRIVQAFVDARLVVSHGSGDEAVVEVAHEALLRQWSPLRQAIDASRQSLALRGDLERQAADLGPPGPKRLLSPLLRAERLAAASEWAEHHSDEIGPLEHEFVVAGNAVQGRTIRRLRALVGGLSVLLVVALVAGGWAIKRGGVPRRRHAWLYLASSRSRRTSWWTPSRTWSFWPACRA